MARNRNPTWARDELILALDLYFKHHPKLPPSGDHPDVIALSQCLNSLPIFPPEERQGNFRNPAGVYMKLANFQWIDPDLPGGFKAVGQRDREVWAEFATDRTGLHELALAIRRNATAPEAELAAGDYFEDMEATEGRILLRLHRSRERNRAIVKSRKERALKDTGKLTCEACGFDFREAYGDLGVGFIECHHTVPVSELEPGKATKMGDLALLCANCHRMIHRSKPMKTVADLRAIFSVDAKSG